MNAIAMRKWVRVITTCQLDTQLLSDAPCLPLRLRRIGFPCLLFLLVNLDVDPVPSAVPALSFPSQLNPLFWHLQAGSHHRSDRNKKKIRGINRNRIHRFPFCSDSTDIRSSHLISTTPQPLTHAIQPKPCPPAMLCRYEGFNALGVFIEYLTVGEGV